MIGLIADVHLGNPRRHGGPLVSGINRRCRQALDVLKRAVELANNQGCQALVVLGDLFDATNPPQQVVAATQGILSLAKMPIYLLLGNHDQVSMDPGDHALGPLGPVAQVVSEPTAVVEGGVELLLVPFRPGPAEEWLSGAVKEAGATSTAPGKPATLLLHLGLADAETPAYLRGAHDSVTAGQLADLCSAHGIGACFAGNWHEHRVLRDDPLIVQVGALCPTGFDNEGLRGYGRVVFWDGRSMEVEEVPGPRFLKLEPGENWDSRETGNCQVYVEFRCPPKGVPAALADVREAVDDGIIVAGDVVADQTVVRAAARSAATAARSADTLDQALAGYVESMELEEGVDRGAVLARVKGYLAT